MATHDAMSEDPPLETNGSGRPVTGMTPRFMPLLVTECVESHSCLMLTVPAMTIEE